jgi:tetratricopeptide (TPR) repeat protein
MQGKFVKAESILRKAITINSAVLGKHHPSATRDLSTLGSVLKDQGRYQEAEAVFHEAIRLLQPLYGMDHSDVADCLNNLAELSYLNGRYEDAKRQYWRAHMIRSYLHGHDSSAVGETLAGLGVVYQAQGRQAEAKSLFSKALSITEKPARSQLTWGRLDERDLRELHAQDREQLAYRGKIFVRQVGHYHPDFADHFDRLGELLRLLGRYADAEIVYRRSIGIRKKAFGDNHPLVGQTMSNIAHMLDAQGNVGDSLELARAAVEIFSQRISSYPIDHAEYAAGERRRWRNTFLLLLSLVNTKHAETEPHRLLEESFAAIQYANASAAAEKPLTLAQAKNLLEPNETLVIHAASATSVFIAVIKRNKVEVRLIGGPLSAALELLEGDFVGRSLPPVLLMPNGKLTKTPYISVASFAELRANRTHGANEARGEDLPGR